jgi:hypothetical protein
VERDSDPQTACVGCGSLQRHVTGAAYEPLPKLRRKAHRPSCLDLVTPPRKEMAEHPELLAEFQTNIADTQPVRAAAA